MACQCGAFCSFCGKCGRRVKDEFSALIPKDLPAPGVSRAPDCDERRREDEEHGEGPRQTSH